MGVQGPSSTPAVVPPHDSHHGDLAALPSEDWTPRSRDLARLLGRAGSGDPVAFHALYERTAAQLFGVVLRINRDRGEAEDVLQEVYVSVWHAAGAFDAARSQPLTWLTRIARNRAIDSLRRRHAEPRRSAASTKDPDDEIASEMAGPLTLLGRAGDARALNACMDGLSAPQRQSVALAFYDGLSHAEVADRMGQPIGTVKSWVRRGLLALRGCLENKVRHDRSGPNPD